MNEATAMNQPWCPRIRRRGLIPRTRNLASVAGRKAETLVILAVAVLIVIGVSAPSAAVTLLPGQIIVTAIPDEAVIVRLTALGPDSDQDVIASGGFLQMPIGVAVANGQAGPVVLVLDRTCCSGGARVIAVNPTDGSQTILSPVSSSPSVFERPTGIAVSPDGAVFVSDASCCGGHGGVIQVAADGSQTVVSSGQLFQAPVGIAVTIDGALYVADQPSGLVQVSLPDGAQTAVMVEGNPITPEAVASAVNRLRVIQRNAQNGFEVVEVTPATGLQTTFSSGQRLAFPVGLAASAFAVYVADSRCCVIGGVIVASLGGDQTILASGNDLDNPTSIAVVPEPSLGPERSCGGGVLCACGDRVVRDHTLRGADPVTRMVCPADGLAVASGVTLDLGEATLEGRGAGVGVRLDAGARGVTVRRGTLRGFATGVRGESVSGAHLAKLNVRDNAGDGIVLVGESQVIEQSAIDNNQGHGVAVLGGDIRLLSVRARGNVRAGILVAGSDGALEQI